MSAIDFFLSHRELHAMLKQKCTSRSKNSLFGRGWTFSLRYSMKKTLQVFSFEILPGVGYEGFFALMFRWQDSRWKMNVGEGFLGV